MVGIVYPRGLVKVGVEVVGAHLYCGQEEVGQEVEEANRVLAQEQ